MNHFSSKPRLVLFAASAALVAGGVLAPATAFAATPATSHAVRADGDTGDGPSLLLYTSEHSVLGTDHRSGEDHPGTWGDGKQGKGPGKHGSPESPVMRVPKHPQWQCVAAPCGPPGETEEWTDGWPFSPRVTE
ncbi:hypothetical protein SAVIM338S_07070 [Streptomyces avidinii]